MGLYIQKLQGMDELCAAPPEPQDVDQRGKNAKDIMFLNINSPGSWHAMVKLKITSIIITVL